MNSWQPINCYENRKANKMKKKGFLKNLLTYAIFLILVGVTFYVVFKNNNFSDFMTNLKGANFTFIGLGILSMFVFLCSEAMNIQRILKTFDHKLTISQAFRYSLVGFFFSSITPSSTGGQPAQIYFMAKDDIPLSHSTLALLVQLSGYQLATGILALIGFFLNFRIIVHSLGNLKFLIFLGIAINLIILAGLIVMIFSKSLALKLVDLLCKILKFFHYTNVDKFKSAFLIQIEEYHRCSVYLKENKSVLAKVITTNIVQLTAYHSVPYFIYLSFGLSGSSAISIILMEAVLYIAVASLPFPGAVGISEGSFMIMFKLFFPTHLLGSAMIISRGISFYLFVLISAIGVFASFIRTKKKSKRET